MDQANLNTHWANAEAALVRASKSGVANATKTAEAQLALAELAACDFVLRYPDVSFGKLT
jgi:hypothetical protein